jgi:hypothetical protein
VATPVDEGVANLERFCALLAKTNETLKDQTSRMEAQGREIDRLEDSAEDAFASLDREAAELHKPLEEGAAAQELDDLGSAAAAVTEEQLPRANEDLGDADTSLEQRLAGASGELENDFGELAASGFEELASALDAAQGGVEAAAAAVTAAFDALIHALQDGSRKVEGLGTETAAGLDAASTHLTGEEIPGLEAEGSQCGAAWTEELPSSLESRCAGVEADMDGVYDGFEEQGLAAGDAVIEHVASRGQQCARFLIEEQGGQLEDAEAAVVAEACPALVAEVTQAQSTLGGVAETTGALDPMVDELRVCTSVVSVVDRLLNAVEG